MHKTEWLDYINLINREVVPALGCTEPVTVALAAARAVEALGKTPEKVTARVSSNLLKNGMGVVVPGTGMAGLPIAAAVGAICGKSELGLEVLRDLTAEAVEQGKKMIGQGQALVELANTDELLYAEVIASAGDDSGRCIIAQEHNAIVCVERNGREVFSSPWPHDIETEEAWNLTVESIYDFAMNAPFDTISFILEAARLNNSVAQAGLAGEYGLKVGRSIYEDIKSGFRSDDMALFATRLTAAASDARMDGIMKPVMSNSGSGNQGITATMPVVAYARWLKKSDEDLARALIMSHLTAIHLKHYLGRLSALCGAILAATGASCGIVVLLGGGLEEIEYAIKNMIGSITGMICDGAKSSCALKVAAAVEAAINSAYLAMRKNGVPGREGILDCNLEAAIKNLGNLGSFGMVGTDKVILDIMIAKQ
ncbi:MAG: serine dehydratase subunit alpha family protein [Desulfobacteraceae bacterium]|nr:serine dehydratase subunit alpha family protein [Desulfobacteraceae bacterium]